MTVTPLTGTSAAGELDAPLGATLAPSAGGNFANAVLDALQTAAVALDRADGAERAFASGRGGLQEMVLERAQADVTLSVASTAASRVSQALGTILGMQV
ncbi:MAG: flagellar hook-basal body complex protein FliE [Candidatus Eremiobacteraeota bacterium]|nr:flagellar hook-basal body complex protein FliE [Candidatus Eremiobacteraeota bacterium]MBC5801529.1 flagellar hook-basal body complex protein FliE [Candidatus Eremiobacteraeota bacterium]MBC5821078.1 flagellar hook-basal body complex protein FliE [Candidatus Eremiobacteraeota bacterium]